jgi:hypothetical protein
MRSSVGFYSTPAETFYIDHQGWIWRLGAEIDRVRALPEDAARLHNSIVEERLWQLVGSDPRIAFERKARGRVRWDGFMIGALSPEAEARFWDLVRDD